MNKILIRTCPYLSVFSLKRIKVPHFIRTVNFTLLVLKKFDSEGVPSESHLRGWIHLKILNCFLLHAFLISIRLQLGFFVLKYCWLFFPSNYRLLFFFHFLEWFICWTPFFFVLFSACDIFILSFLVQVIYWIDVSNIQVS